MIDNVVLLLRARGEYLTPEIKFFIITLCHFSSDKEAIVKVESEKALANVLGVSLSTVKQGIRYLEAQDFLLCDKTEAAVVKLEFTDAFFKYATKVSGNVEVEKIVGQRIDNLLSSEIFKSLSKRVAAKLFLLTLLAHSDEYGIVRNLSIKDLQELMGRFSKDRHRSQLELLKRAGYILGYNPGMSGGLILGKQKSEYLIKTTHKAMQSSSSTKTHSRLVIKNKSDSDFIAIRLSNLIDDIQKIDVHHEGTTKKINNLLQDLSLDGINEIEKVGNAFSGEVRGFQIQRFIFTLALYHLNKHDWKLPDVDQVRNSLDFEELFSEKFLRETLRVLIGDKEKISQKPLKEQVTHYEKLKLYMDQLMKSAPDTITTTNTNAHRITAITTLIAHCVVFTSKFIKLFSEKVDLSNAIGIAVFSNGEDIMLHFH